VSLYAYYRIGPDRYLECFGLDFEDFAAGQRFEHRPGVTVSQQDNVEHALDTMNSAMLHFDAAYAGHTSWGRPLMVSTLTVQRVIGMAARTFARRKALLTFSEIVLSEPVFGGDTLYATSEVLAAEQGEDPEAGIVTVQARGIKASGAEVVRMRYRAAIYRRGRGPDADRDGSPAEEARFAAYEPVDEGLRERCGLFFEDCRPGERFVHSPRRSFLRDEAIQQAHRSMEHAPQYHDVDWADRYLGGQLCIPETFVLAAAATASTRTFGRVSANLGWYDIQFPAAVRANDTVRAESEIVTARASKSRPAEGIVSVVTCARNQRQELVLSFRRSLLVYRRGAGSPYRRAGYS
jgi:itaconyl-CoA hydratase